jgi:hypothetical protein
LAFFFPKPNIARSPARPAADADVVLGPTLSIAPLWLTIGFFAGRRAAVFAGSSLRPAAALTIVSVDFIDKISGPGLADLSAEV